MRACIQLFSLLIVSAQCFQGDKMTPGFFGTGGMVGSGDDFSGLGVGRYGERIGVTTETAGRAEALRRFAESRATKTGTTIAGVVFKV